MSVSVTAVLMRCRILAWLTVLIITAGVGYGMKTAGPTYSDGATVVLSLRHPMTNSPAKANSIDASLVATEVMLAQTTIGYASTSAGKVQIVAFPCNRSNVEYPDYEEQCATLTASAGTPAAVYRAFWLAYRAMKSRLLRLQASVRVTPYNRIQTYLVGISGPVPQPGSRTRVYGGLGLLGLLGILLTSRFFALRRRSARSRQRPARSGRRRHAGRRRATEADRGQPTV